MDRFTTDTESLENQEIRTGAESEPPVQMEPNPQQDVFALASTDSSAMQMAPLVTNESSMDVEEDMDEEESSEEPELTDTGPEGSLPSVPPEDEEDNPFGNAQASGRYTSQTDTTDNAKDLENDRDQPIEARSDTQAETPGEHPQMEETPDIATLTETTQESVAAIRPSPEEDKWAIDRSTTKQDQPVSMEAGKEVGQMTADGEPAETSAEGVSEGGEDVQETLETGSSEAMMRSLTSMSATDFVNGMKEASAAAVGLQEEEKKKQQESLPEIDQPTGIPTKTQKKAEETKLKKEGAPDLEAKGNEEGKQVETEHKQAEGPVPGANVSRFREPEGGDEEDSGNWWSRLFSRIKAYLRSLPDSDSGVNTSAGKRPNVDLSGKADPGQNKEHKAKADTKIEKNKADVHKETAKDFGEHDIYPDIETETLSSSTEITGAGPREEKPLGERQLDPDVEAALNTNLQPRMNDEVAPKNQEFGEAHQEYETDSAREKEEGLAKIAEETERVKAEQEGEQATAKNEVESEREKWREENENVKQRYEEQSAEKKKEIDQKIEKEVISAEEKADKKLDEAEKKAENEKRVAEEKARKKKQEAKKKPKSFWGRVKGAVSSVFDKIRSAINAIFEGLRKLVKGIIEAAKKLVKGIIELARRAVVGLIRAFGEALKKFVSIALAAFPELAEKARNAIDKAVNKAVETVNKAAQALKDFADKVLDAIGAALDFILSVYQKIYNAILDALEFIAIGLIEIIEGMANLVTAARQMPDHFWGQVSEELLGMDISKPLPAIERKEPRKVPGQGIGMTSSSSVADPESQTLLNKSELAESDVVIEPVPEIELPTELFSSIVVPEGQGIMFGQEGESDLSMDELRALSGGEVVSETNEDGEVSESAVPAEGGGSDIANMSDEEKMNYYLSQMKPQCSDMEGEQPTGESDSSIPDEAKVGPLSVSQRAGFIAEQLKVGISNWWECNKVMIISIMVGALLALGVAAFFTGGAAIVAALKALMVALTVIFGAVLIARMSYHFGLYLKQAWSGDIEAGAKSLARAIAVGLVELVFNFIFKVGGVLLKVVKQIAKTVAKAAKATGKAAIKTAKATGRLALKTGKQAAKGGAKITKRIAKPIVSKGKVFINGIKKGFASGVKSLDDLGQKLKRHFGFKGFSMRIKGSRFFLYGHFNPKKLLATGNVKKISDKETKRLARQGGNREIVGKSFHTGGKKAIVVSDDFARKLEAMTPAERAAKFKELEKMSADEIRRLTGVGKSTARLRKGIKGGQPPNYQAHHIIPEELYNNPAIKKFLDDIGFGIQNGAQNGIMLPPSKSARFGKWSDATIHIGSHPNYTVRMKKIIERIKLAYQTAVKNGVPPAVAREAALKNLSAEIRIVRKGLMKGSIKLN